ncbi:MAG: hypothetical protein ACFCUR_17550 [Rhodomicrobiaceae bacterium]
MGRSFDRGGQNRKEKERGKRRAYRQAERDREAREAVMQAKRTASSAEFAKRRRPPRLTPAVPVMVAQAQPQARPMEPSIPPAREHKRPGFLSQVIGRFFKKSA